MEKLSLVELEETNAGGWLSTTVSAACVGFGVTGVAAGLGVVALNPVGAGVLLVAELGCIGWALYNAK